VLRDFAPTLAGAKAAADYGVTAGFRYMAPFLGAHGFRVYCPDMPGFGLTEDPYGGYRHGQGGHVDFIQDFVNAIALDRFHIAGNSMGCVNSVQYTLAHPERVDSMALIAGSVGDLVPWVDLLAADTRPADAKPHLGAFDGSSESMRRMMETIMLRKEGIGDDLVLMRTLAANRNLDFYQHIMGEFWAAVMATNDVNEQARLRTKGRLDLMSVPTIYLYGVEDVLSPVECGYLQEDHLPNIQFFYPENTGHQGQTDQPELHNQVFLEFFRDGRISGATAQAAGVSSRRPINPNIVAVGA
jgi:pimeloyl-ACP methyl ester carboxylesterase